MKTILLLINVFCILYCKPQEVTKGTLYFKKVEFINMYNMSSEQQLAFTEYISALKEKNTNDKNQQELISHVDFLEKNGLEKSPYVKLLLDDNKIITVFMNEQDYKQFASYSLDNLLLENKKVEVELKVTKLRPSIFICDKIILTKIVPGVTPWDK